MLLNLGFHSTKLGRLCRFTFFFFFHHPDYTRARLQDSVVVGLLLQWVWRRLWWHKMLVTSSVPALVLHLHHSARSIMWDQSFTSQKHSSSSSLSPEGVIGLWSLLSCVQLRFQRFKAEKKGLFPVTSWWRNAASSGIFFLKWCTDFLMLPGALRLTLLSHNAADLWG